MEGKVITRPEIALERRMLGRKGARDIGAVVDVREASRHEALVEHDLHAQCRARENALADRIRGEAADAWAAEVEGQRASARESGFAQGQREGLEGALAEARAAEASRDRKVEALVAAVRSAHDAALEAARDGALAIGFAAACRILGDALVTPEGVRAAVDQVLAHAHAAERVTVRLAPADLERLGAAALAAAQRRIDFVADASLEPGGCCVETSAGTLDGRLRTQMEGLYRALCEAHSAAGENGGGA
jgi:flagellar assembly protein FliH